MLKELKEEFKGRNIKHSFEYIIPTSQSKKYSLDIYIHAPVRAFVEFFYTKKQKTTQLEARIQNIRNIYDAFDAAIVPILVINDEIEKEAFGALNDLPIHFIKVNFEAEGVGKYIAQQIADGIVSKNSPYSKIGQMDSDSLANYSVWNQILKEFSMQELVKDPSKLERYKDVFNKKISGDWQSYVARNYFLERREWSSMEKAQFVLQLVAEPETDHYEDSIKSILGDFSNEIPIFQPFIDKDAFLTLTHEIIEFNREHEAGHYTASGLRIGRAIEHIIYSLSRAWGVSINRHTLQFIQDLRNSVQEIETSVIDYLGGNEEKKSQIQALVGSLHVKLNNIYSTLEKDPVAKNSIQPVNIQALLKDISKKYAKNAQITNSLKKLRKGKVIESLLKKRNLAAHASMSLDSNELTENDIEEMIGQVKIMLTIFGSISLHASRETD